MLEGMLTRQKLALRKQDEFFMELDVYYTKENGKVYLNFKIGNLFWKQETKYKSLPVNFNLCTSTKNRGN